MFSTPFRPALYNPRVASPGMSRRVKKTRVTTPSTVTSIWISFFAAYSAMAGGSYSAMSTS